MKSFRNPSVAVSPLALAVAALCLTAMPADQNPRHLDIHWRINAQKAFDDAKRLQKPMLIVAAAGATPLALPAVLLTEAPSVAVGESARLLVHSGLADQEMVLEIFRHGAAAERRRLDSAAGLHLVEIPITPELRGGFGVRLSALRDHQLMTLESSIFVPWDDRRLQVEFALDPVVVFQPARAVDDGVDQVAVQARLAGGDPAAFDAQREFDAAAADARGHRSADTGLPRREFGG